MMNGTKHFALSALRLIALLVKALLQRWLLILIVAFFYFEQGPHFYWSGEYRAFGGNRAYISCTYIGSRGPVHLDFRHFNDKCPFVMWLDSRKVAS